MQAKEYFASDFEIPKKKLKITEENNINNKQNGYYHYSDNRKVKTCLT